MGMCAVNNLSHLRKLAAQWAQDRRLAEFLAYVEERVQVEEDQERRVHAARWLAWARECLRQRDPLSRCIADA